MLRMASMAFLASVALTACNTAPSSPAPMAQAPVAATASMAQADPATTMNGMLVGPTQMTLYVFDKDAAGKSMCNGGCATNWPPLMAPANAAPIGDWSVVMRDDGSKQWAYKGRPLYHWAKDTKPGDMTGDGLLNNSWHVAKP